MNVSPSPAPLLAFHNVSKRYDDIVAVDEVTFEVGAGKTLALIGASGSGKTTTLKMINRLIEPDAGTISLFGSTVSSWRTHELRRKIGYVFQDIGLFPHMSVAENIAVTPELLGWPQNRIEEKIDKLLALTRLDPERFRNAEPTELSGGQQQRVAIARALAAEPELILLDEAFGALDPVTRDELREDFKAIQKELGLTVIMVTHDMAEAALMADEIAILQNGKIVQNAPPSNILTTPANSYVSKLFEAPRREAAIFAEPGTKP